MNRCPQSTARMDPNAANGVMWGSCLTARAYCRPKLLSKPIGALHLSTSTQNLQVLGPYCWQSRKAVASLRCLVSLSSYDSAAGGSTCCRVFFLGQRISTRVIVLCTAARRYSTDPKSRHLRRGCKTETRRALLASLRWMPVRWELGSGRSGGSLRIVVR